MAQDRSADIARLERDIGRLEDAENKAGEMLQENVILLEDLGDLDDAYKGSVKIPQLDFRARMMDLNREIRPQTCSICGKIGQILSKLRVLLEKYREEQRQYEEEQRQAQKNAEQQNAGQQVG